MDEDHLKAEEGVEGVNPWTKQVSSVSIIINLDTFGSNVQVGTRRPTMLNWRKKKRYCSWLILR